MIGLSLINLVFRTSASYIIERSADPILYTGDRGRVEGKRRRKMEKTEGLRGNGGGKRRKGRG